MAVDGQEESPPSRCLGSFGCNVTVRPASDTFGTPSKGAARPGRSYPSTCLSDGQHLLVPSTRYLSIQTFDWLSVPPFTGQPSVRAATYLEVSMLKWTQSGTDRRNVNAARNFDHPPIVVKGTLTGTIPQTLQEGIDKH